MSKLPRLRCILAAWVGTLAFAEQAGAQSPVRPGERPVGLCVLVAKSDLRIRDAVVVKPSGDPAKDKMARADAIGMKTPTPVAWTHDFWTPLWIGGQPVGEANCDAMNRKLCGKADCRMR